VHVQDKLNAEAKKIAEERAKYERMVAEFERGREKLLDRELREACKKIEEMIQGAKVQDVFRRHEELQKIKKQLPEIVKPQSSSASSDRRIETAEDFATAFPAGATVYVPLVGRDGIVLGKPNTKGEVPVLSSSMRIMV